MSLRRHCTGPVLRARSASLTDTTQAVAATYAYDWGLTTSTTGAQATNNPWQYAGGYYDASTQRIKFGARYYNPYRGRFTQTDPSGQEANRYVYATCNPINKSDRTGLYTFGEAVSDCATGAATSAAIGLGLGTISGGLGLIGALGGGCLVSVATGVLASLITDNPTQEGQVRSGLGYLEWLHDVTQVVKAIF